MKEQQLTSTGVLGRHWRAAVTPWGDVCLSDGSDSLTWAIAAEDRWHFPEGETSTRHLRVRGTPVTETRVRVPNGDVVQHVWSAALRNDVTAVLMEFANDSPSPVAVSLSRADVVTPKSYHRFDTVERPWPSHDRGIERPPIVIPLGHRARVRVALARTGAVAENDIDAFPDWNTVVRGWVEIADRASRIEVADLVDGQPLEDVVRARRTDVALADPDVDLRSVAAKVDWLAGHRELVRMGLATPDVPAVVTALEGLLRSVRAQHQLDTSVAGALRAGALILGEVDSRAARDFDRAACRTLRRLGLAARGDQDFIRLVGSSRSRADESSISGDLVATVESEFALWSARDEVTLMPDGFAEHRLGANFEVHHLQAGPGRTLSLAVRWHGDRPAVIWEVDGPPGLLLRSGADPQWTSIESSGETLWNIPSASTMSH